MDSLTQSGKKRGRPKKDKSLHPPPDEEAETPKMRGRQQHHHSPADEKYVQWKSVVPVLYDWLANHNLVWPSLSCRWGPQLETGTYKNRQRLYLSEQTDGSVPNTLVIANCDIVKPRVAASEHISQFNDDSRSPFVKKYKTIIHPGEVNRIRELPQHNHIVATHSDTPDVYIWDIESQSNRHAVLGAVPSRPDMVLTGHQENAEFALAMCPTEPYVLSGGKDKSVVFWSIQDHLTAGATDSSTTKPPESRMSISKENGESPRVGPRGVFQGHDDTVEDVQFCPKSPQEFCSVGDDSCLILWDARSGTSPAVKVEKAHDADLHCVDWSPFDENYILTGSADNSIRMFDRRNLSSGGIGSPVHKFEGHNAAVLCVQWSPDNPTVFGSAAEDGLLNIWNYDKVGQKEENEKGNPALVPGLIFQHAGHRDKVVDFHFNAYDPWTIVSVSDDCDTSGGGGTLQIWRMTDLLYRPRDEVLTELYEFKSHHRPLGLPIRKGQNLGNNQETIQRCWPESVIANILARLPVKSVFRSKSVCKSWCLLIRSRFFVDLHRTHPHKDRHQNQLFFSRLGKHGVDVFSKDFSSSCCLSESAPLFDVGGLREALTGLTLDEIYRELSHVTFITHPHGVKKALEPDMKVLGPLSNGICCVIAEIRALVPIIGTSGFCNPAICNPATRELKLISPPKCRLFPPHKQYYGFCSIQASDGVVVNYKIVVIHQHELRAAVFGYEKFTAFVYSLRSDTWTEYTGTECGCNEHLRGSRKALAAFMHKNKVELPRITQDLEFLPQAFVNGSCHWMAEGLVLQLDMTEEVFGSFVGPPMDYANLPDYPLMKRGVFVFNDHLFAIFVICGHVSGVCVDHEIDVWMMMEYGVATSWTKIHSSKFQFEGVFEKFLGMFFSKESHGIERMFFQDKAGVFMSYDCSTTTITTMEKDGTCDSSLICWKTIGILEYCETLEPVSLEDNVEDTILSI